MENREREMLDELMDMAEEIQVPEGLTPDAVEKKLLEVDERKPARKRAPHFDSRACGGMLPACMRGCLQDMEPAECGRRGRLPFYRRPEDGRRDRDGGEL